MNRKFLWIGLIVFLCVGGFLLYRRIGTLTVIVVSPTRGTAVRAVYATGTVEATVMFPIAARTGGRLIELNVDEGSEVKKDQILGKLEDDDLVQARNEMQARADYAKSEFERYTALVEKKVVSRSAYDRARAELAAMQAAVSAAEARMDFMTLRSPEDGRVIRRDGEIGQYIPVNQPVFWLSCCAPFRVSAEVDEEDIGLVQPDQEVLIRADAFPDQIFHGKVLSITPKGDLVARSFRVRIGFREANPLLIGMTAETNIITSRQPDALLLPSEAVVGKRVWVVRDGILYAEPVEVGARGPDKTEILSGLEENAVVVLNSDPKLTVGRRVRIEVAAQD